MAEITDEVMRERLALTRSYTIALLRKGPAYGTEGSDAIIWEHGRRNMSLREQGLLQIVCPINDGTDAAGVGVFGAAVEQVREVLDGDPAIQAQVLTYELHPARGFPGDGLRPW